MKAYEDTYKAILFVDFYRHKKMEVMRNFFDELYDEVLNNIDIKYIAPVSSIQKITQAFKLNNVDYTYVQNNSTYTCLAKLDIPDMTINVTASGSSKRSARNSAAKKLLKWFYDQIESFLSGETDMEYDYIKLQKFLSFILNERTEEFSKLIFENNYFGLCDAINGDKHRFIEKLSNILIKSIYNFEDLTYKNIVTLLTSIPQINLVYLNDTNILIEAVIWDLYEFLLHQTETKSKIEPYSLEKNDKKLCERTRELLIKYVSDDGLLIRKIKDPDVELQIAAVKNNPRAIHYLISPAKEVLEYLLETQSQSKEIESLVLSKASNDVDFLIDMMSKKYKKYLDQNNGDVLFSILSETVTFDIHIRALFRLTEIKKFYIATGFVYSSGLDLLKNEIDQLLNQHGELKMVIGSLQNYNNGQIMKNMDRKTAIYLNEMIKKGCLIKTYDDRFYHGKMYYLESESLSIVIVGSSNLSKNAFHNNKELDVIFFYRNKPENEYSNWFEELWLNANSVSQLDVSRFSATLEYDTTIEVESNLKTISRQNVEKRINSIPDEMLRKRLLLWLEYNPSNIYDDIKVAGQDYIAIEYSEREMIVLESFLHGNSYFVFYNVSINTLLELIDNKSKSEIFALSNMEKRGYHVRNLLTLELNVKSYFLN
jgi:HKD family nuclease